MIIYLNYKISEFYQKIAEAEIMVRDNNDRDKYGPFSKKDQITAVIIKLTRVHKLWNMKYNSPDDRKANGPIVPMTEERRA